MSVIWTAPDGTTLTTDDLAEAGPLTTFEITVTMETDKDGKRLWPPPPKITRPDGSAVDVPEILRRKREGRSND